MKIEERDAILEQIEKIKQFDIVELISSQYENETDIESISIGRYPMDKFVKFFNNAILFLEAELKTDNFYFYPIQASAQPIANINLSSTLSNILAHLENGTVLQLPGIIDKLITYQNYFGFWRASAYKIHDVNEEEVKDLAQKLKITSKNYEKQLALLKSTYDELISEKNSLNDYVQSRKKEMESITQSLQSVKNTVQEVETLKTNAVNKDTEISGLLKNIQDKIKQVQSDITNYQKSFKEIDINWNEIKNDLDGTIKTVNKNFEQSKSDISFIEGKKALIEKLTGMAADGALGSKFNDRESKLKEKIPFWRGAIIAMTIISIAWAVIVFTCLNANFNNDWINLGVNLLKTTPAFILLGFVFKQYSKERNLEEEYAFKSAVAMTLTAYSNMLAEGDREHNDSKQKMLLASIERLYTEPKIYSEKRGTLFSFNTNRLKDAVDSLNENLKNIN